MKSSEETIQKIIREARNVPWLTPLWSMLYNEGIRGNHILFSKNDLKTFKEEKLDQNELKKLSESEKFEDTMYQILCCPDYRSMTKVIDSQEKQAKHLIYTFYMRTLDHLKVMRAAKLN